MFKFGIQAGGWRHYAGGDDAFVVVETNEHETFIEIAKLVSDHGLKSIIQTNEINEYAKYTIRVMLTGANPDKYIELLNYLQSVKGNK